MDNSLTPETTHLRVYNVTGNVVAANTPRSDAGERITDDFHVRVSHVLDDDTQYLVFTLGCSDIHDLNEPAKLVFEREHISDILSTYFTQDKLTTTVHGQVYRSSDPAPERLDSNIPLTVTTVATPQNPSGGIIITAGEDNQEGATIEFSPEQSRELKKLFGQFLGGTITDSRLGVKPRHVDETGARHPLDQ